jgi:uncharacterized protein YjbJ (UPF0337 family)
MNWDVMEGNWKQFKGKAKEQWGKLTDDQVDAIRGKRDQLAGKIQEAYGDREINRRAQAGRVRPASAKTLEKRDRLQSLQLSPKRVFACWHCILVLAAKVTAISG